MNELRLFLAVQIPEESRSVLLGLMRQLPREGPRGVEPGNLHITLKFLGAVPESRLPELQSHLQSVSFLPFPLLLRGVGVFPDPDHIRVVWVGIDSPGLEALAHRINDALAPAFPKEKFTPHLTIARVKHKVELTGFLAHHAKMEFGRFEVREFLLMKSELGKGAPRYSAIHRFPCG